MYYEDYDLTLLRSKITDIERRLSATDNPIKQEFLRELLEHAYHKLYSIEGIGE